MALNDVPCGKCRHYDPINPGRSSHGWCAVRSIYPLRAEPGQTFPPGVKRADLGQHAKPFIVRARTAVPTCTLVKPK